MTWRKATRNRRTVVAGALVVAICGVVPMGVARADEPAPTPEPAAEPAPEPAAEPAPETGEVDGAVVAVGLPPVPPSSDEPQVAVGLPPVPPSTDEPQVAVGLPPVPPRSTPKPTVERKVEATPTVVVPPALAGTVSAALDLIDSCL